MEKEEKQQLFEDVYLLFQNGVCVCMFSSHLSFLGCVWLKITFRKSPYPSVPNAHG